jgi:hypothetical protein
MWIAMLPSGRIYPQVIAVEISAAVVVAILRWPESTPIRFNDLVSLYRPILVIPGTIVTENDNFTGADGYFFAGKTC